MPLSFLFACSTGWLFPCLPRGLFPCLQLGLFPCLLPDGASLQHPGLQRLPDGAPFRQVAFLAGACCDSRFPRSSTAPRPASCSSAPQLLLPIGALAGNKPHPAEKSTPVWLAIWRTWAGFANSQLRRAALRCIYLYICANPHCFHLETAAQTDANLSAHLHRLPTPPPYLRRMRLPPGQGRRCWMANAAAA